MRIGRIAILALTSGLLGVSALAAPPVLRDLSPAGGARGTVVQVALIGDGLTPDLELISATPAKWAPAGPTRGAGVPVFRVEIPADAECGYYPVRVRTAEGVSQHRVFVVGDQAEGNEIEPNDEPEKAPAFKPPYTLNGRIEGSDQDWFRFAARNGDRWTFEIEARRLGSDLDAMLRINTLAGKPLAAENDSAGLDGDARVEFTAPADGEYVVGVHDYKYRGRGSYRLRAGRFESPAVIFPMGGRRGWTTAVQTGVGSYRVAVDAPAGADMTVVRLGAADGSTTVRPFAVGDGAEFVETADRALALTGPAVINGRLSKREEIDTHRLTLPAGSWIAEVDAIALGSQLDPVLTVSVNGAVVGSASDGVTPRAAFTVPAGAKDVRVTVEDLHRRGGPSFGYRLKLSRAAVDYRLQIVTPLVNIPRRGFATVQVKATRNGYNEPIQLSVEGLAGVRASGGLIPANGTDGTLLLTADTDAEFAAADLQVWGNGGNTASPVRRRAAGAAVNRSPWIHPSLHWSLPAAIASEPPIVVAWDVPAAGKAFNVVIGTNTPLPVKATRAKNAGEAVTLAPLPKTLPRGWESAPAVVAKGAATGSVTLVAKEATGGQPVPPATAELLFTAKTTVDGRAIEVPLPPLRVTTVPPFTVETPDATATVTAGGKARLVVVVRRAGGYANPVTAALEGLPAGVTVGKITPVSGNIVEIELSAAADAKAGEYEATVKATGRLKDRAYDYSPPPAKVKIKVGSSPAKPPMAAAR